DFQDSPDDENDTRSSQEYLNDLEEEYQARDLLAKSKRFFKKGNQRLNIAKSTDQTECHKCDKNGHFHKPELRPTKDFEAKYNKVNAKLALLSLSASASKALMVKNKGLIAESYEWDKKEVSSDENEMVEVKVLMELAEDNDAVSKEGAQNSESVKISIRKVHTLLEMEDNDDMKNYLEYLCIDLNYVETKDYQINFEGQSTFKAEALKGVILNKPSSTPAKGNKSSSALKVNSALAGEALQAKNVDALKSKKTGSSKANKSKTPTRGWVSR
nr:hypothetical protein [Tanacetum cinerariifolium]